MGAAERKERKMKSNSKRGPGLAARLRRFARGHGRGIGRARAALMALVLAASQLLGAISPAAALASENGDSVYLTIGSGDTYGGGVAVQRDFWIDGTRAYCSDVQKPHPPEGWYTRSAITATDPSRADEVVADLWFGYDGPGFDESMWPDTWYDGTPMTAFDYQVATHIIIADTKWSDGSMALLGTTEEFKNWICWNILGFSRVDGSLANPDATGRQMANRKGEVPDRFDAFQINLNSATQTIVSFSYQPLVQVDFTKVSADASITDGNAEYAYSGATYDIYLASDDSYVTTITTDESGHASYELEPNEYYYAIETKAPQGFKRNPERIEFQTGNTTSAERLADDPGTIYFTVHKKDSATGGDPQPGASLEGAEYKLIDANGNTHTATSNEQGYVFFNSIPFGTCTVVETKAPEGYKLDTEVKTYTVHASQATDGGDFYLEPEDDFVEHVVAFDLDLVKYKDSGEEGSGLQQPAEGVQFQIISGTTGEVVGTIMTDENGYATTEGKWFGEGTSNGNIKGALPYDAAGYVVREVASTTPDGYQPAPDWHVTPEQMADGATLHYIVDNDFVSSRIQVVKTDAETGQTVPLAGFTFQLLDSDKQPITQEVWYPNHSELSEFVTDESGMVTFPEALMPGTYYVREVASEPPYLLNGDDLRVEIGDEPTLAPVTVVKVSDEQAMGRATITKVCAGSDGATVDEGCEGSLPGAEFDVVAQQDVVSPDGTVRAVEGQVVDHVTTGEDGTAATKELYLGSGTATYAFVETKAPEGHVLDQTPHEFTLTYQDQDTEVVWAEAQAENAPTEFVLDKGVMGTDDVLPGATFALWNAEDEPEVPVDDSHGAIAIRPSDEAGEIDWSSATAKGVVDFGVVTADAEGYTITATGEDGSSHELSGAESGLPAGTYAISVTDETGSDVELSGSREIAVEAGKAYSVSVTTSLAEGAKLAVEVGDMDLAEFPLSLDEETQAYVATGLPAGTYAISCSSGGIGRVEVDSGEVSYALLGADGLERVPMLLKGGAMPAECVTGPDGRIVVRHLPKGSYRILETAAPAGYLVDPDVHYFTVDEDGMTEGMPSFGIEVDDDYTKVDVSKADITDEAEIPGAKLSVRDSAGNVIDSWTSGDEPHRISALAPGDYVLVEEMTPHDYDQAEEVPFTVLETGEVQKVVMHDEPIGITGEIDKRQEIADPTALYTEANGDGANAAETSLSDDGSYDYSLDYRSTSTTWTDEFTVEDGLDAVGDGVAELVGITTAQGWQDYDGLMNVWYKTDQTPADYVDGSGANATLSDGHENPWLTDESNAERLGDDGRAIDYAGWRLWKADVSTTEATELKVSDLGLAEGEHVTGIRFEYGRVEEGFTTRADDWDRENIKSGHDDLDDVQATHEGDGFEVPGCNVVTLGDGSSVQMSDAELAACEDGAGYMVDPDGDGMPEFVPYESVERIDARQASYAPAVIHMRVTDAYVEGTQLDNSAKVDLYRNGGGDGLEDHDDDEVTQNPKEELPEIGTTLTDAEDGDQVVEPGEVELVDTVEFTGAEPGVEHTMTLTLMDRASGEALEDDEGNPVTSSVEFTPDAEDGTVEVPVELDTSDLVGHELVAFEEMSYVRTETALDEETGEAVETEVEVTVASHEDIDDAGQTVRVEAPPAEAPDSPGTLDHTGSNMAAIGGAALAVAACAGLAYAYRRHRSGGDSPDDGPEGGDSPDDGPVDGDAAEPSDE